MSRLLRSQGDGGKLDADPAAEPMVRELCALLARILRRTSGSEQDAIGQTTPRDALSKPAGPPVSEVEERMPHNRAP